MSWTARLELDLDQLRRLADGQETQDLSGRALAQSLGYDPRQLDRIPSSALQGFAGSSCPFGSRRLLRRGQRVVVLGGGALVDGFIAAHQVGLEGAVVGLDSSGPRIAAAWSAWYEGEPRDQLSFGRAFLSDLPVANGWADVVIPNGAFAADADPERILQEATRVLRVGGRLVIAGHGSYRLDPDRAWPSPSIGRAPLRLGA